MSDSTKYHYFEVNARNFLNLYSDAFLLHSFRVHTVFFKTNFLSICVNSLGVHALFSIALSCLWFDALSESWFSGVTCRQTVA
jgi:hypothetical protein